VALFAPPHCRHLASAQRQKMMPLIAWRDTDRSLPVAP
jgi:hypothetical protein